MTNNVNDYINAATHDNTRRAYQGTIEHYEVDYGGFLPALYVNTILHQIILR